MAANGHCIVNGGALTVDTFTTSTGPFALDSSGDLKVNTDKFTITASSGNTAIGGTFSVAGASTFTGAVAMNGGITCDTNKFTVADTSGNVLTAGTLTVTGAAALNGGITCDTNKFTVADTTGNTSIGGSLMVTGASTFIGAFGYDSTMGGTVTQTTNRTTGVTLSKLSGQITTNTGSLAAGAEATFTVTNTEVSAYDVVAISLATKSATGLSIPFVSNVAAGSFDITLSNLHATTADTSASVINFVVIKGGIGE